jgi:hypothetical protein
MQTTDFGDRDDRAALRRLDWATVGGVLVEREMGPGAVIVRNVRSQDATQVWLAQHENMVETLAPDRADEPFREGVRIGYRLQPNTT